MSTLTHLGEMGHIYHEGMILIINVEVLVMLRKICIKTDLYILTRQL